MKELSDQRDFFHESISNLEGKIGTVRTFMQSQNQARDREYAALNVVESKPMKKAQRRTKKGDRDSNYDGASVSSSPLKSNLKR